MNTLMSPRAKAELKRFEELSRRIMKSTAAPIGETSAVQEARVKRLLGDFDAFCRYYFAHYMDADFAWFHRRAYKNLTASKNYYGVWRWPRGHAKSVFADIMVPMNLLAKDELSGLLLASANNDKALGLLHDIQAELENTSALSPISGTKKYMAIGETTTSSPAMVLAFGLLARGRVPGAHVRQRSGPTSGLLMTLIQRTWSRTRPGWKRSKIGSMRISLGHWT